MKKILILVQSCTKDFYPDLMKGQQRTWDSIEVPGVETFYYYGGGGVTHFMGKEIVAACSDDYEMMHWKLKIAFDYVWDLEWDYIFRTNASTYVRKDKILEFIQDKPLEKYYSGCTHGGNYCSGTNAFISRDLVDIYRKNASIEPTGSEDAYLGTIIIRHSGVKEIEGVSRPHFDFANERPERFYSKEGIEGDCYRCKNYDFKNAAGEIDRHEDIRAFETLFNFFNKK